MSEVETKMVEIEVPVNSKVMYDGSFTDVIWVPMQRFEAEHFLSELAKAPPFEFDTEKEPYFGILREIGDRIFCLLQGTGSYFDRTSTPKVPLSEREV